MIECLGQSQHFDFPSILLTMDSVQLQPEWTCMIHDITSVSKALPKQPVEVFSKGIIPIGAELDLLWDSCFRSANSLKSGLLRACISSCLCRACLLEV